MCAALERSGRSGTSGGGPEGGSKGGAGGAVRVRHLGIVQSDRDQRDQTFVVCEVLLCLNGLRRC